MLVQRDSFISFEPNRIVTYKKWAKFIPGELTQDEMMKVVSEGIAGNMHLAGVAFKRDDSDKRNDNLIRDNQYNGWLNAAAARNMRVILMNWTQAIQMHSNAQTVDQERIYPILLTLTWPGTQFVSDYDAKACLDKFLAYLNRKEHTRYESEKRHINSLHGGKAKKILRDRLLFEAAEIHRRALKKYLWRAEPQENGNIHFHLLLDQWMDKDVIRKRWNQCIEEYAGAVSMYQQSQQMHYRIIHSVKNNPETVYASAAADWNPKKPFVYKGYRFRVDKDQLEMKLRSIRERLNKAISIQKIPYMIEEGAVLAPIFKESLKSKKQPSTAALLLAAERLQLNAFCKAVDNEFMDPPTTRIESMRNVRSMAAYLAKYLAKPSVKEIKTQVDLQEEAQKPGYEWIGEKLFDDQENEVLPETSTFVTEGRRLHGRIWGKSKALNIVKDFGFFKLSESSYTSFHGMVNMGEEVKEKKVTRKVPNPDLFGTVHYETVTETERKVVPLIDYKKATGSRVIQAAFPYYQSVLDFVGQDNYWQDTPEGKDPNITIVKLSHKLVRNQDQEKTFSKPTVIHFNQQQLMQKFAPELKDAYLAHYHDLFYTIYNSPQHLKDGAEPPKYGVPATNRLRFMPRIELSVIAA